MTSAVMQRVSQEELLHRGEIRLEVCLTQSSIAPQWWEMRRRYRLWRIAQYVKSNRKKLSPETQAALAWAEESIERDYLFGKDNW